MKRRLLVAALVALGLALGTARMTAESDILCALCSIYEPGDIYYVLYGCAFCAPTAAAKK